MAIPSENPGSLAGHEMTRYLRDRISQRERAQHQVAILSGGTLAAAAPVLAHTEVSPWVIMGLTILMLAFALSMLNNDFHIIAAATFMVEQDNEDAVVQRAWEIHLQGELGRSGSGAGWIRTNLQLVTPYALPVLGAIGGMALFLVYGTGWQRCAIILPLGLSVLFALTALSVRRGYWRIFVRAKALVAEDRAR